MKYKKGNAVKFTAGGAWQTGTPTTLGGTNTPLWRTTTGRTAELKTISVTNKDASARIVKIRDSASDDVVFTREFATGGSTITDISSHEFIGTLEASVTSVTSSVYIDVGLVEKDG